MYLRTLLSSALCLFVLSLLAQAPEYPKVFRLQLTLKDSSTYMGRILEAEEEQFLFYGKNIRRRFNVARQNILQIDTLGPWRPFLDGFHNVATPANGFNLRQGDVYYKNYWLSLNTVHVGLTDRFSMGVGVDILTSLFSDGLTPTMVFMPKYTFPIRDRFQAGVGAIWLRVPDFDGFISHQFYYVALSYGEAYSNISAGLNYTVVEGEFIPDPVFTFAAKKRLSSWVGLEMEYYMGAPLEGLGALVGVQFIGRRLDFSVSVPIAAEQNSFFLSPVPLLGLGVKFTERR